MATNYLSAVPAVVVVVGRGDQTESSARKDRDLRFFLKNNGSAGRPGRIAIAGIHLESTGKAFSFSLGVAVVYFAHAAEQLESGAMGGDISLKNPGLPGEEPGHPPEESIGNTQEGVSSASWNRVFQYAYSLIGDRTAAEDITQDAFVVLFKDAEATRRVEHFGAWMRGVTRNLVRRRYHKLRPDLHVSLDSMNGQDDSAAFHLADPAPSIENMVIQRGLVELSAKIVFEFPERERECILMYFSGYEFHQIARVLGVSRWTARRITLKALEKFHIRMNRSGK